MELEQGDSSAEKLWVSIFVLTNIAQYYDNFKYINIAISEAFLRDT
jgi:hypothetical protein